MMRKLGSQKVDLMGICHFYFCSVSESLYFEGMLHFLNFGSRQNRTSHGRFEDEGHNFMVNHMVFWRTFQSGVNDAMKNGQGDYTQGRGLNSSCIQWQYQCLLHLHRDLWMVPGMRRSGSILVCPNSIGSFLFTNLILHKILLLLICDSPQIFPMNCFLFKTTINSVTCHQNLISPKSSIDFAYSLHSISSVGNAMKELILGNGAFL